VVVDAREPIGVAAREQDADAGDERQQARGCADRPTPTPATVAGPHGNIAPAVSPDDEVVLPVPGHRAASVGRSSMLTIPVIGGCLGLVRPRLWSLASRAHGAGVDEVGDTGLVVGPRADGLGDQLPRADGTSGTFWSTFGADGAGAGERGHTRRRRPRAAAVVALLVLAAVVGTGYGVFTAHHSGPLIPGTATAVLPSEPAGASPTTPAPTADAAPTGSPVPVLFTTSYDPSGGSGFVRVAPGSYETQHYASAAFGGLKPGVGLLLDLGQPRTISAVEVTSAAAGTRGGLGRVAQVNAVTCGMVRVCHVMRCSPRISGLG